MKYLVSTINCYYYFHCINEETEAGSIEDTYLCDIAIESWRKKKINLSVTQEFTY